MCGRRGRARALFRGQGGARPSGGFLLSPAVWVLIRSQRPRWDDLEKAFWAVTTPLRVTLGTHIGVWRLDMLIAP